VLRPGHRAYTGRADAPKWLDVREGLRVAGFDDRRAFDAWVRDPARRESEHRFTEEHYDRENCEAFDREAGAVASAKRTTAESIVVSTIEVVGVSLEQLQGSSRGPAEVLGRAVAVRCATIAGVSGRTIAGLLGLSESRVSALRNTPVGGPLRGVCDEVSRRVERASLTREHDAIAGSA